MPFAGPNVLADHQGAARGQDGEVMKQGDVAGIH